MKEKRCYGCMKLKTSSPVCEHCGYDETQGNAIHQLPLGTVLKEQYVVGKVLGQGGFGITYLGWDLYLDAPVAIKEFYPSGTVMRESTYSMEVASLEGEEGSRFQNSKERFLREAKMLARFSDVAGIVQVKNFFLANNTAYIIMEYVKGITLKEYVRRNGGKLSVNETFRILGPIMTALGKVHKAGIIHRDISPDNIMLLPDGKVKLLDFGAVRDVGAASVDKGLSKSTEAILKQGYAPIEQYQKRGSLGPWTDVYAMCATIYYCLIGNPPLDAPERVLMNSDLELEKDAPGLSRGVIDVLNRGLNVRVEDRTGSMETLYQEFASALQGSPAPDPNPDPDPAPDPDLEPDPNPEPKRGILRWIAVALSAVLVIGVLALLVSPKDVQPVPSTEESTETVLVESVETRAIIDENAAAENILMGNTIEDDETEPEESAFNTQAARKDVQTITFLDLLVDAPADAVDASAAQNGKVKAWAVKNGEFYDLYIAADGGVYAPADSSGLFAWFTNLITISFGDSFYTEPVQDMSYMFYGCENVGQLDVSKFNTSNVTDMKYMFDKCQSLQELDVSNFETDKVTSMAHMFCLCESIKKLDVSGFNTENVESMFAMFNHCKSLTELDVSNLKTDKVTYMSYMFRNCESLSQLNISGFNTSNVIKMQNMFEECKKLTELDVSNFKTSNVTDMSYMFSNCESLSQLDVSGFHTAAVQSMKGMFRGCQNLTQLDVSGFNTARVTEMDNMFCDCTNLKELDVSGFNTARVNNMEGLFIGCSSLTVLNVSGFDTHNVTNMTSMFYGCSTLAKLDVSHFNTARVTSMYAMFYLCSSLQELDVAGFNTSNVENMRAMFSGCSGIKALDVSHFNTAKVNTMRNMFGECSNLKTVDVSNFKTSAVTDMSYMFYKCYELKTLQLANFDTSKVTSMAGLFYECSKLGWVNVSNFNTSKVTDMSYMFYKCGSASSLNLSGFDTSQVVSYDSFMEEGIVVNGRPWEKLFVN